ncbi:T9SS type A sorting domain-containing protein [Geofilum sp. OHC36d9]|uniref:T9SS type A sorting domain-containing protein n=1 Tax=Geofilum sp. OHC36d9 TaxID=3458413 RepID=UPI004033E19F
MKTVKQRALILLVMFVGFNTIKAQIGDVLWEENFDTLNTDVWNIDIGDGCDAGICGWGNSELQYYNSDNVYIEEVPGEDGNKALVLEAIKESMGSCSFTSGKITTKDNLSVQYGVIEIRMQAPDLDNGLWPAAWLLGTADLSWPSNGEIDMMEMGHTLSARTNQGYPNSSVNNYVGSNAIFYSSECNCAGSIAYDADYNTPYVSEIPLNNRFVIYRLYWEPSELRFTVTDNGTEHDLYAAPLPLDAEGDTKIFQRPFYMLLDLAVGGTFTDATSNELVTAPLPGKMLVDYIKIYEWNGYGSVTAETGEIEAETGVFGVYTNNTATNNKLTPGLDSEIYVWGNTLQEGTIAPFEGDDVIAWKTVNANSWFGAGIISLFGKNLSNYTANGFLKFKIKIPADVSFKIGITDNYTNQTYLSFPASENKYGLTRDGEWGQVSIPLSEYEGLLAFQNISYLFTILSDDNDLPTQIFEFAIDDIIFTGAPDSDDGDNTGDDTSDDDTSGCIIAGYTDDFTVLVTSDLENPSLTFIPSRTNVGSSVCILYYGNTEDAIMPGYLVSPNEAYQIQATEGQEVFFYYTYSLPEGGENNTLANKNSFTVGNCGSLKTATLSNINTLHEAISVFPNPANDVIYISGISNDTPIEIFNAEGVLIKKTAGSTLDISGLEKGIYWVKIFSEKMTNTIKILKK